MVGKKAGESQQVTNYSTISGCEKNNNIYIENPFFTTIICYQKRI